MVVVIALPITFRRDVKYVNKTDDVLVIISAHTESIRYEFEKAFSDWYYEKTGRTVYIDWRIPGGASDIMKFLDATYNNAFKLYWENTLHRTWSLKIQNAYKNHRIKLNETDRNDTLEESARRAFLTSNVGCDIDLWFGSGVHDFITQAKKGRLVASKIVDRFPKWFKENGIPLYYGGHYIRDPHHRWFGATFSGFGIVYNTFILKKLEFKEEPNNWQSLANPILFGEVALSDPTKSGSINKAFEMIIQHEILKLYQSLVLFDKSKKEQEVLINKAINKGWMSAMKVIQLIAANSRNFTERGGKPVTDITAGNCAIGLGLDFYSRYQQQNLIDRGGADRVRFILPEGSSSVEPDCIGILKGAPHLNIAEFFLEFVLSIEGQKLWSYIPGAPNGPSYFTLRRLPVRKDFYTIENMKYSSDPNVNPYKDSINSQYHPEWTSKLFDSIRLIIRSAFIDPHRELKYAWHEIIKARKEGRLKEANYAEAYMSDIQYISYKNSMSIIRTALLSSNSLDRMSIQSQLTNDCIHRYKKAAKIAKGNF